MKKPITQLLGVCTALASLLVACKKDEVQAIVTPSGQPALSASASTVVLTQASASQTAITFNWKPLTSMVSGTDSPYKPGTTYQLQIAKAGTNFAKPVSLDAGAGPNTVFTVSDLNDALQAVGLTAGVSGQVEIRLNATYAANYVLSSPSVPLTATTYSFCGQPAKSWSLIGDAANGWNAGNDIMMSYDCTSKTYTYVGPLKAKLGSNVAGYKFRYNNDWTANLGGAIPTGGALTQDGPNLGVAADGTYTIVLTPGTIGADGKVSGGSFTIK